MDACTAGQAVSLAEIALGPFSQSSLQGTYHGFKFDKYSARYLSELQYRFNRRFDLPQLIPRLLRACALTTARPEKWLRSAEAWG